MYGRTHGRTRCRASGEQPEYAIPNYELDEGSEIGVVVMWKGHIFVRWETRTPRSIEFT